jgi:hypothetical protein
MNDIAQWAGFCAQRKRDLIYAATINMAYSEYGSNIHHGLVINWTGNNLLAKLSPVLKLWLGPLAWLVWLFKTMGVMGILITYANIKCNCVE